ncbi:P-type ATPase [Babesia caballi]|uniref:P-type ATPase n=1 Tax=Babesia caballi TaxID=5871 RepID=A0AAV4LX88_BABCB|nr:P-type ATPase [Babesia caballi]
MLRLPLFARAYGLKHVSVGGGRRMSAALSRRAHHVAAAAIRDVHELLRSKDGLTDSSREVIAERLRGIRASALSKQEAFLALQLCLEAGCFERELLRGCLSVLEAGYFGPALVDGWDGEEPLVAEFVEKAPRNCHDAVDAMRVRDKVAMVVWQDRLALGSCSRAQESDAPKPQRSAEIDPEKREVFTTRKLGKVLDPKPLRVRIRTMAPGKKLCSALALQLREAVPDAPLADLGAICAMFAARRPLSGQLNDDTMAMLAGRLYSFTAEELAACVPSIAVLCDAAAARAVETWSYHRASGGARASEAHRLYRIGRQQLPKAFLARVAAATEVYARGEAGRVALGPWTGHPLEQVEQQLYTLRSLARSDVPLSMPLWNALIAGVGNSLDGGEVATTRGGLWLLEAMNASKYTTPATVSLARRMLGSCETPGDSAAEELDIGPLAVSQVLRLIVAYSMANDARKVVEALLGGCQRHLLSYPSHIRAVVMQSLRDIKAHLPPELARSLERRGT